SERSGRRPARAVLFFLNEPDVNRQLLAINVDQPIIGAALEWTKSEVRQLQETVQNFMEQPSSVMGGGVEGVVSEELRQQCTACSIRYDCDAYGSLLKRRDGRRPADIDIYNVNKN